MRRTSLVMGIMAARAGADQVPYASDPPHFRLGSNRERVRGAGLQPPQQPRRRPRRSPRGNLIMAYRNRDSFLCLNHSKRFHQFRRHAKRC